MKKINKQTILSVGDYLYLSDKHTLEDLEMDKVIIDIIKRAETFHAESDFLKIRNLNKDSFEVGSINLAYLNDDDLEENELEKISFCDTERMFKGEYSQTHFYLYLINKTFIKMIKNEMISQKSKIFFEEVKKIESAFQKVEKFFEK